MGDPNVTLLNKQTKSHFKLKSNCYPNDKIFKKVEWHKPGYTVTVTEHINPFQKRTHSLCDIGIVTYFTRQQIDLIRRDQIIQAFLYLT